MRRSLLALLLGLTVSCAPSFEVPEDARISCRADSDCPSGWACLTRFERCVRPSSSGAPTIVSATLRCPGGFDSARAGDVVEVDFEVSAPLAYPPEVRLDATPARTLWKKQEDATRFTYALNVGADLSEGRFRLLASLVAASGQAALDLPLGPELIVDHRRPELAGELAIAPEHVADGQEFSLTLTTSEPLAAPPTVELRAAGAVGPVAQAGTPEPLEPTRWRLPFTALASGLPGQDVWASASVLLVDRAGHSAIIELPRVLRLDFRGPQALAESARVSIVPGPTNPLAFPTALTVGSQLEAWLSFDEPLKPGSRVQLCLQLPTPLCARSTADDSPVYHFTLELEDAHHAIPEGDYLLRATATDLVGNEATASLGAARSVHVDTQSPAPPDVSRLVHTRIPYGFSHQDTKTTFSPTFHLHGTAGAAEPLGTVLALAAATGDEELGRLAVAADGSLGADPLGTAGPQGSGLRRTDQEDLWVEAVDAAGNRSPRVKVASSVWVATLGGKIAGDVTRNPLGFELRHALSETAQELGAEGVAASGDGELLTNRTGGRWREHLDQAPGPQWFHAATWDDRNSRLLVFGRVPGTCATPAQCEPLWARSANGWEPLIPAPDSPRPVLREGAAMAFDTRRGRALLLGGRVTGTADAWWWDGRRWSPACAPTDTVCRDVIAKRDSHAMVYDQRRDRMLVLGGRQGMTVLYDAWEFDGTQWRAIPTPQRMTFGGAAAYDPGGGKTLLFGGTYLLNGTEVVNTNALLEFDGTAWEQRCDGVPASDTCAEQPVGVRYPSAAFDTSRGRLLVTGGWPSSTLATWEWTGSAWVKAPTSDLGGDGEPAARWTATAVFDPSKRRTVLLGGTNAMGPSGGTPKELPIAPSTGIAAEVWERGADDWAPVHGWSAAPDLGGSFPLVAHPTSRMLLSWEARKGLLWTWNGSAWSSHDLSALPRPTMSEYDLVPDSASGGLLLLGGSPSEAWRLTGAIGSFSWQSLTPPAASGNALLASEPASGAVWALTNSGGPNRFWSWTGTGWDERCEGTPATDSCSLPPMVALGDMAYDPASQRLLLVAHASAATCAETWAWDGSSWAHLTGAATCLPAAAHPRLVLHPDSGRLLWATTSGELWAWQSSAWTRLEMTGLPSAVSRPLLGASRAGEVVWASPGRTWTWRAEDAWPSQVLTVPLAAALPLTARADATGATLRNALTSAEVRWWAGGRGTSGATPAPGAELLALVSGTWSAITANASETPELLQQTWTGAPLGLLPFAPSTDPGAPALRFGVRAKAAFVDALSMDYVEVRLRFERPE